MTLVTHFGRTPDGEYTSIEQFFDGGDIPEGTTFVGFDAVKFAQATGRVAVIGGVEYDTIEDNGSFLGVENTDDRWEVEATIENDNINFRYYGLGSKMISALVEHGIEDPKLTADCLQVVQHIDVIGGSIDYIADGPLDFIATKRYSGDTVPRTDSEVSTVPEIGLLSAFRANPDDYLLPTSPANDPDLNT